VLTLHNDLLASGHQVTVFHRGTSPLEPPTGAEVLYGDRNRLGDSIVRPPSFRLEVVIDAIAFTQHKPSLLSEVFRGIATAWWSEQRDVLPGKRYTFRARAER